MGDLGLSAMVWFNYGDSLLFIDRGASFSVKHVSESLCHKGFLFLLAMEVNKGGAQVCEANLGHGAEDLGLVGGSA